MIPKPQIVEKYITNTLNYTPIVSRVVTGTVLHTEGAPKIYSNADRSLYNYFQTNTRRVSAHFYITFSGVIEQYVRLKDIAHHTLGDGNQNVQTIGIEHQDNGFWETGESYTDMQYRASAHLVAWLAEQYNFPLEVKKAGGVALHRMHDSKPCPGAIDYNKIIYYAKTMSSDLALAQRLYNHLSQQRTEVITYKRYPADSRPFYDITNIMVWWINWGVFEALRQLKYAGLYDPDIIYPNDVLNYLLDVVAPKINVWEVKKPDSDKDSDISNEDLLIASKTKELFNILHK